MENPPVSIVLRSYNEAWALRDTLSALKSQHYRDWELIVFDSGSVDGSVELIREVQPKHFIQMLPHEYRPGRVMNQAMELASHNRVIFLNADATPQGPDWLRPLVQALDDSRVAAVFSRQIPRPDCLAPFARDYELCFGPRRKSDKWGHFFSMVSSGLQRGPWSERGFLETMQYSEDDEYTRWCSTNGYQISFCPESVVMHSHNYTPRQIYKRSFGESWALARVWTGRPEDINFHRTVMFGLVSDAARDLAYCIRNRRTFEWPQSLAIRWKQRLGRLHGFQAGWNMHRIDSVL